MHTDKNLNISEFFCAFVSGPESTCLYFLNRCFNPEELFVISSLHPAENLSIALIEERLKNRLSCVFVSIHSKQQIKELINLAKSYHAQTVAIQIADDFDRNAHIGPKLRPVDFNVYYTIPEAIVDEYSIQRFLLKCNREDLTGPFDIIGDVHGCYDELLLLLSKLGYQVDSNTLAVSHPKGRMLVFLGDLVDRGPKIVEVLKLVMTGVVNKTMLCVSGNHEQKLLRKLKGADVKFVHGLKESWDQIKANNDNEWTQELIVFLSRMSAHYVLDNKKLVVAHAGLKEDYQGRNSAKVRSFAYYGQATGEFDENGLPVAYPWANDYKGQAMVVHGHIPVRTSDWNNNTIDIDNGCVHGGNLTALRYPEKELVSVKSLREYYPSVKPFV